ncbi:hypothetical protein JHK85_045671 [Glycine max]|nr:hypothetical protein JHK85_045671 [Glycine max]
MRRFKETEDCFIVGFDPSAAAVPLLVDSSANDVSVIAEKGQCLLLTTTKTSFYIGGKPTSMTGPTPSLFQVSLYVDNNDIGQLAPVFVMEKNNVSG